MNYSDLKQNNDELKNHLYCVGTIYDNFDALIEVLGHLKLEQPLYLVYLAQKLFAQEVFNAANNQSINEHFPYETIELKTESFTRKVN
jgi:hypothetical protein